MKLSAFDFSLPSELIAQNPVQIRDRSRLMIIDRKSGHIEEGGFRDIVNYLYPKDLMVLNNTRVFPARLHATKEYTGGKLEVLLIYPTEKGSWFCMIKGKVKIGQRLVFATKRLSGIVEGKEGDGKCKVRFEWEGDFFSLLEKYGQMPLPPYIKRPNSLPLDLKRYQTVFAKHTGAIAAPTAGLHFTKRLLNKIKGMGIEMAFVTLHVGPGTFKPIRENEIEDHVMDKEIYSITPKDLKMITTAKNSGRRIIAIGTTTTRTLETIYQKGTPTLSSLQGWTDLFITPGFRFKAVDALITNFHLPLSTLLILVCAFGGYDLIMEAYNLAIKKKYRFYSYGDAMFIT
ncbi:MAG: tRNA preQ1(34) S-adenosylmethionine ribosyltransferase-isomerase QueA [bacterium]